MAAKQPHRELVVVGQVVNLAPLAAVTDDQIVCGWEAGCAAPVLRATIVAPSSRVLDALGGDVGGDACIVVYS